MAKRSDTRSRTGLVGRRGDSAARSRQRTRALRFEPLEDRRLLSVVPSLSAAGHVHPTYVPLTSDYTGSANPSGLTPSQIRGAYGLGAFGSALTFPGTSIQGDGTGQTIAIVDVYDDPSALNDLNSFSAYYGLPQFNAAGDPTFQKLGENGGTSLPGTDPTGAGNDTWEIEESLDIEWAHVMAPMANIILFEANSTSNNDLFQAVKTAAAAPGAVVVSMSWAGNEFSGETSYDTDLTTPAGHLGGSATMGGTELAGGVTFLASAGDEGAYGSTTQTETTITPQYPACSPNVVAVGGTSLYPSGNGFGSESTWANGTSSGTAGGGGGGISTFESQPTFQTQPPSPNNVVNQYNTFSTTNRVYPDVSADANPDTGVSLYDTWDFGTKDPWFQVGGTSLSCPLWAGIISVADQGRAIEGLGSLNGRTQTLPALYNMAAASSYNTYFNDITTGNSIGPTSGSPSYLPGTGFDLATGLGSPKAAALIPELVGSSMLVFAQGPSNTVAGANISPSITVDVENGLGQIVTTDDSIVTLTIGDNPGGGTLSGTVTVAAVNGVATFSNLSINKAGTGYTLTATDGSLTAATSTAFNVTVGAAGKVVFSTQPASTAAGATISPAVQVSVEDVGGNVVTSDNSNVTIVIGTDPGGGALSGTLTVAAVNGVATFNNLSINATGTGYTLTAADGSLTGSTSAAFNILGAASKVVFTTQPGSTAAGASISPAVQVSVEDANGNLVASDNSSVTIAIGTNPVAAHLAAP